MLERGVSGLRVGILLEGFGHQNSDPTVDARVRDAAKRFESLGADVREVHVPEHASASAIWVAAGVQGLTQMIGNGHGFGMGRPDAYPTSFLEHLRGQSSQRASLPPHVLLMMLVGESVRLQRGWTLYGKAQNLARRLRSCYDKALQEVDVLLMPTTPMVATPLPPSDAPLALSWQRAAEMLTNTCPFDVTHHPALSLPCGLSDGLPVGLMLVGRHHDEGTLYRAGHAFERGFDWRSVL